MNSLPTTGCRSIISTSRATILRPRTASLKLAYPSTPTRLKAHGLFPLFFSSFVSVSKETTVLHVYCMLKCQNLCFRNEALLHGSVHAKHFQSACLPSSSPKAIARQTFSEFLRNTDILRQTKSLDPQAVKLFSSWERSGRSTLIIRATLFEIALFSTQ